jgi:hypothetical protein
MLIRKDLLDNLLELAYLNAKEGEHWITVKPHGDESKGTHLLVKEGESNKEAVQRKFGGSQDKKEASKEHKYSKLFHGTNIDLKDIKNPAETNKRSALGKAFYLSFDEETSKSYGSILKNISLKKDTNIIGLDKDSYEKPSKEQIIKIKDSLIKNGIKAEMKDKDSIMSGIGFIDFSGTAEMSYRRLLNGLKESHLDKLEKVFMDAGIDGVQSRKNIALYNVNKIEKMA